MVELSVDPPPDFCDGKIGPSQLTRDAEEKACRGRAPAPGLERRERDCIVKETERTCAELFAGSHRELSVRRYDGRREAMHRSVSVDDHLRRGNYIRIRNALAYRGKWRHP